MDKDEFRQTSRRRSQAETISRTGFNGIFRGVIKGVHCRDTVKGQRTLVDLFMLENLPPLFKVPLMHAKISKENGEDWTPEVGDAVVVSFFGGRIDDPMVIGYEPIPDNAIEGSAAEAPRYHKRRNNTTETIDKDGNRVTLIQGNEDVTVKTGDLTIDVQQGQCTVHVKGKTVWTSEGTIEHVGKAGGTATGNVTFECICPLFRAGHIMGSSTVKSSL